MGERDITPERIQAEEALRRVLHTVPGEDNNYDYGDDNDKAKNLLIRFGFRTDDKENRKVHLQFWNSEPTSLAAFELLKEKLAALEIPDLETVSMEFAAETIGFSMQETSLGPTIDIDNQAFFDLLQSFPQHKR